MAERAGVSVATVSRALRGLPNVAESTRQRVLQAAAELDYVVNPNASRLAAGHNRTIGIVLPQVEGWYFQQVLAGVENSLSHAGYDMLLYAVATPDARERFLTTLPFRKRVDGLVLIDVPLTDPEQRMLAGLDTNIVGVGVGGVHFPAIRIDNQAAARLATRFLIDLGHRRIGLITGLVDDPMRFSVSRERQAGWREALEEVGVSPKPDWEVTGDFRMSEGAECMDILLNTAPEVTAVFVMSDEMAIGAMAALSRRGIAVPEQMSIVGFDGYEVTQFLGITTVCQPMTALGRLAGEALLTDIRGGDARVGAPAFLPVSLIVRDTTAAPREAPLSPSSL